MATTTTAEQMPELTREFTNAQKFFTYFQHAVTDLTEQMDRLQEHGTSGGERADAVDHCQASIARLSDSVKDASSILPAHDQRTYGDAIKALSQKLSKIKSTFAPRPKFAFKSGLTFSAKKNNSAISLNDAAEMARQQRRNVPGYVPDSSAESSIATTPAHLRSPAPETETVEEEDPRSQPSNISLRPEGSQIRMPSFSQSSSIRLDDHEGIHIVLPPSAAHATSSGTLSNLHRCVVDLSSPTASGHPFAGITLKNISRCLIICGNVEGAAHLTNVSNSVVVVASRQFRMHESRNCDVYLQTSSRPIIEDCGGIHFAPFPGKFVREQDQCVENQWSQVDDFKWLGSEPSPNWSTLDLPHRVRDEVWEKVVPGGPAFGVDDVLGAVGVPAV